MVSFQKEKNYELYALSGLLFFLPEIVLELVWVPTDNLKMDFQFLKIEMFFLVIAVGAILAIKLFERQEFTFARMNVLRFNGSMLPEIVALFFILCACRDVDSAKTFIILASMSISYVFLAICAANSSKETQKIILSIALAPAAMKTIGAFVVAVMTWIGFLENTKFIEIVNLGISDRVSFLTSEANGFGLNAAIFALWSCYMWATSADFKHRLTYSSALIIALTMVYLSGSRGAMIFVLVSVWSFWFAMVLGSKKKNLLITCSSIAIVCQLGFAGFFRLSSDLNALTSGRWDRNVQALTMIAQDPLFGHGFATSSKLIYGHLGNLYLVLALEIGLVGTIMIFYLTLKNTFKSLQRVLTNKKQETQETLYKALFLFSFVIGIHVWSIAELSLFRITSIHFVSVFIFTSLVFQGKKSKDAI